MVTKHGQWLSYMQIGEWQKMNICEPTSKSCLFFSVRRYVKAWDTSELIPQFL